MTPGTRVKWITASGVAGSGMVILRRDGVGDTAVLQAPHYFVACDALPGEEHRVIYCAETWLTPETAEVTP